MSGNASYRLDNTAVLSVESVEAPEVITSDAIDDRLVDTYARLKDVNAPSQRWIYSSATTQTYSFNTPVGADADKQCGRAIYSSFHVTTGAGGVFPSGCDDQPMTAQEKALEFMLFDLSACVQKDDAPPEPPPVVK